MKKSIIIFLASSSLILSSCGKFVDGYEESPNSPADVTEPLLLSAAEVATFTHYGGQLSRTSSIFMQQSAGTDFQMIDVEDYNVLEGDNVNEWSSIYNKGLLTCNTLMEKSATTNPWYHGIAGVIKAMNLGLATDFWGDVPNTEASMAVKGAENYNPHFDLQEQVIADIQTLLSAAIVDLSKADTDNKLLPAEDDIVFGGDVNKWIRTAYILKARYAIRTTKKNSNAAATAALAALSAADLSAGSADDCMAIWSTAGNELNQWSAFIATRSNYIHMGKTLVDMLVSANDPRLEEYCNTDDAGGYSGSAPGSYDITTSVIGSHFASDDSPSPLVTYFEAKFIEAEAHKILGHDPEALAAFQEAVSTSVLGVDPAAAGGAFLSGINAMTVVSMQDIMEQKYIAMFTQPEVWSDWRRTNIPALSPNANGVVNGVPRRLVTPLSERLYNSNAVVNSNLLSPVWWDQ